MKFYHKLRSELPGLKKEELDMLPRSYNILGDILILKLKPLLVKHEGDIGKAVLKIIPYIRTVCLDKGIEGITRKPAIEVIAGSKNTETIHTEHGCKFFLDVSESMWSKGNKFERERMMKSVKKGEIIVDMFAGIGYWSIFMAKGPVKKVYSIDINPKAMEYLEKNARLNKVSEKIEILQGDCRSFSDMLEKTADRIIMGYFGTKEFLPYAIKMARPGAIIHYHDVSPIEKIDDLKEYLGKFGRITGIRKVKSYAPNVVHVVMDLRMN